MYPLDKINRGRIRPICFVPGCASLCSSGIRGILTLIDLSHPRLPKHEPMTRAHGGCKARSLLNQAEIVLHGVQADILDPTDPPERGPTQPWRKPNLAYCPISVGI